MTAGFFLAGFAPDFLAAAGFLAPELFIRFLAADLFARALAAGFFAAGFFAAVFCFGGAADFGFAIRVVVLFAATCGCAGDAGRGPGGIP